MEMLTEQKIIKELERKILKLEKQITAQKTLIDVLRVRPENMRTKKEPSRKGVKKDEVPKRAQGKSNSKVTISTPREPSVDSAVITSNSANAQVVEETSL